MNEYNDRSTREIVEKLRKAGNDWCDAASNRLEFLERALEQAVGLAGIELKKTPFEDADLPEWEVVAGDKWASLETSVPNLAAWLQEHNASTVPVGDGA